MTPIRDMTDADLREPVLASYSGGLGSFLAAYRAILKYGHKNVTLVFADTHAEDEDLYRFNRDVEAFLKKKIVGVSRDDHSMPWDIPFERKFLNGQKMNCSRALKGEPLDAYAVSIGARRRVVGLDWTEGHRLQRLRERRPEFEWEAPLMQPPILTKDGIKTEVERLGLRIPRMYLEGYEHNNCGGSCLKAGIGHWIHHLQTRPCAYAESERKENEFRALYGDYSILKDRRGGTTKPLPLSELRKRVQGGDAGLFADEEWGGCGCAVDIDEPEELEAEHDQHT